MSAVVNTPITLGVVAHVDAGKTTLTERLLYAGGARDHLGSVDAGTTATDTMDVERRRGITVRAAVASFQLNGTQVNVLDTPGHPDFVAEVERSLLVLDAAILVVSAVEGVQPQTVVLGRTLRRLGIPTIVFLNKTDRPESNPDRAMAALRARTGMPLLDLARPADLLGLIADLDDRTLQRWLAGDPPPRSQLETTGWEQAREARLWPVVAGSARSGAGIAELQDALAQLAPDRESVDEKLSGVVFKVESEPGTPRSALLRLWSGDLRVGDRISVAGREPQRVKAIEVATPDGFATARQAGAGDIARVRGWVDARIGDGIGQIGYRQTSVTRKATMHAVVRATSPAQVSALGTALRELQEIDPMIQLGADSESGELTVELLGEVQKEVLAEVLATTYGVPVEFGDTGMVCIERVASTGTAFDVIATDDNPYLATIGLRVGPAAPGTGITIELDVELGSMPRSFFTAIEESIHEQLRHGLSGWEIPDAVVGITRTGYWARQSQSHGSFDKSMPSTAKDFRLLTAVVLAAALRRAGTQVCTPVERFSVEAPRAANAELSALFRTHRAVPLSYSDHGDWSTVVGDIRTDRLAGLVAGLPAATSGEGIIEASPDRYEDCDGLSPRRSRPWPDSLDRELFFRHQPR
ncbi:TetM/TetW/TetO/TetS family tetracycline resistance ribosomal protection protein [Kribbella antibiotica]|uniref:TetM/TetW/TetO/TetS family tetracycline resistance ribosomal protection protein n=1 Tax=Kribbella antibiotica TaxID=190195 RepID=A0A4R4ZPT9_9ACTN|nr:TetM/TetW/TetO/TetS family tetracycline resistance ribosomal protection protein [Kribbella antibiotica]TDD59859.1 TetM/TetW/TetO/TetS family tetracycline resistance ribosomal protection protein [Kribbella antibiotica]